MDDGADGAFTGPYSVAPTLDKWNTSLLTLKTGLIYKFKYSASNIHGEGPLSDEVSILLAEKPSTPVALTRVDKTTLLAGQIKVTWVQPIDQGGDPVTGYKLYLNDVLFYDASLFSTLNNFTFTNLSVGLTYKLSVSAINHIGEGLATSITELAASVPMKLAVLTFESSTPTSITLRAPIPSFDGGQSLSLYAFKRDNGPSTAFLA